MELLDAFLKCFIPLFVAMDVYGMLPLYLSLTEGQTADQKKTLVNQAVLTCLGIAILFLLLGDLLFGFLGITEADFRIGGGLLLLVFAISDLLFTGESIRRRRSSSGTIGVVPLGIPLIMGPAAMTTILILVDTFGYWLTIFALVTNLLIVWVSFRHSHIVIRVLGQSGSKAIAKVASLFLAGIGVMMIRIGVTMAIEATKLGN